MRIFYGSALLLLSVWTSNAQVVINEFMFHPEDPKNEWVELYNTTDSAIPLQGWSIKDASKRTKGALSGIVPAGGYLVVARDGELLVDSYSDLEMDCVIEATLSLNHIGATGGDSIILYKADGSVAEAFYYQNKWGPEIGRSLGNEPICQQTIPPTGGHQPPRKVPRHAVPIALHLAFGAMPLPPLVGGSGTTKATRLSKHSGRWIKSPFQSLLLRQLANG